MKDYFNKGTSNELIMQEKDRFNLQRSSYVCTYRRLRDEQISGSGLNIPNSRTLKTFSSVSLKCTGRKSCELQRRLKLLSTVLHNVINLHTFIFLCDTLILETENPLLYLHFYTATGNRPISVRNY
jgi:hypothetical protein